MKKLLVSLAALLLLSCVGALLLLATPASRPAEEPDGHLCEP